MTCCYCGRPTRLEAQVRDELRPICFRPCMHILWAEQAGIRADAPQAPMFIDWPVTVEPGWDVITDLVRRHPSVVWARVKSRSTPRSTRYDGLSANCFKGTHAACKGGRSPNGTGAMGRWYPVPCECPCGHGERSDLRRAVTA